MQQTGSNQTHQLAQAVESLRPEARPEVSARRRQRESGAMLLAVLFLMAMMVITALAIAPAFVQQAKRDREEEMIHRGTEYMRAIKKFYKKFGRYPANLEQLESTNQMRFLRRRYTDPLTKDGKWKLLRYGDIAALGITGLPRIPTGAPGAAQGQGPGAAQGQGPGAALGQGAAGGIQGANPAVVGAQLTPEQLGAFPGNQPPGGDLAGGGTSQQAAGGAAGQSGSNPGTTTGQSGDTSGGQGQSGQTSGTTGQSGSNNSIFGNSGVGGQTFGGGAIVGVASLSQDPTIRIFNKKQKYNEWVFLYSPTLDRQNVLLRGPFNGQMFIAQQTVTPGGQPYTGEYGQGAPGVSLPGVQLPAQGGAGQGSTPPNQPLTPGNQFPPDQAQPQQ
jgi:type II secretory pathway pseudopilin PulG